MALNHTFKKYVYYHELPNPPPKTELAAIGSSNPS